MLHGNHPRSLLAVAAGVLAGLLLAGGVTRADDRQLLLESAGSPYIFVIIDTSDSMTWSPPCLRERALNDMNPFDAMCTTECPLEDAVCAGMCPDFGCREYDFSSIAPPGSVPTIIIDHGQAGATDSGWPGAGVHADAYNGDYLDDGNTGGCGETTSFAACEEAEYNPQNATTALTTAGDYMIFLWWPADATFAPNTLVEIEHDDPDNPGSTTMSSVTVNQKLEGGQWNAIGTYPIDPGLTTTNGQVTIRNENAFGFAVADAVGWLQVEIPPCLDTEVYRCQQPICNTGDCFTSFNGDDPRSKLFQAKEALFESVSNVPNIHFGFATFEQDQLHLSAKHWRYAVAPLADQPGMLPTLDGFDFLSDASEVFGNGAVFFGDGWDCLTGAIGFDGRVGCQNIFPADFTNPWDLERGRRIPRLGFLGTATTPVWFRVDQDSGETFRVEYSLNTLSGSVGSDQILVDVDVFKCPGGSSCAANSSETVLYNKITDYVALDGKALREPQAEGGFFQNQVNSGGAPVAGSGDPEEVRCLGLEENNDEVLAITGPPEECEAGEEDTWCDPPKPPRPDYNLLHATVADPFGRGPLFELGDFVPLDWEDQHRRELLTRLAPNAGAGGSPPDFRSALYFNDTVTGGDSSAVGERLLRLVDPDQRPIVAFGDTPLGESMAEFLEWYENDTDPGFADEAEANDVLWQCRQKGLLMLTDGTEKCLGRPDPRAGGGNFSNDSCDVAADLYTPDWMSLMITEEQAADRQIETFVVGYGLPGSAQNDFECLVENGRDPADVTAEEPGTYLFLPEDKDDLAESLREIFLRLQLESRAFASAALPAIQSTAADNIYLSSFIPLASTAYWPGRIDAFRRPLPLNMDGEPDFDKVCVDLDVLTDDLQSACHSWEAGDELCDQAPSAADADAGTFQLGATIDSQRRILYGQESDGSRPNALRLFSVPTLPADPMAPAPNPMLGADAEDLVAALDPNVRALYEADNIAPSELGDFFTEVIAETVKIKSNALDPGADDFPDTIGGCDTDGDGSNDSYVLGDIFHATPVPIANPNNFTYFAANINGYREFARDHLWRRRMLAAGTNDGQLHFFDIGIRQVVDNDFTDDPNDTVELFNDGGGHELFSYIPRSVLPIVRQQSEEGAEHVFSLDGTVAVGDVYIDPEDASGGFDASEREWRTILVGGLREGGDLFFLDEDARHFKSAYFALDITQPDILNARTDTSDPSKVPCPASDSGCDDTTTSFPVEYTPSCLSVDYAGDGSQVDPPPATCDYPFPAELWTFDGSVKVLETQVPPADNGVPPPNETLTFYLDEDANGIADLADTWSRAVIGQIRVCEDSGTLCDLAGDHSELEAVQVAIFGGGMDPANKGAAEVGGNYLYMINVETGELIYKRELQCPPNDPGCTVGSAAGDPAVIDDNRDGYFDVIYIGTSGGYLYKVDLTAPDAGGLVPGREAATTVNTTQLVELNALGDATRFVDAYGAPPPDYDISLPRRVADAAWDPFVILDTEGAPIYHAPAAFFITELNDYGLAIGTGDREDLWEGDNGPCTNPPCGSFFVLVDEDLENDPDLYDIGLTPACEDRLPITKDCLEEIAFDAAPDLAADYLLDPQPDISAPDPTIRPGWALTTTTDARITNEAFVVSGVLIFSAFDPTIVVTDAGACDQSGTTRAFVVSIKNAGPIAPIGNDPTVTVSPGDPGERNIDRYQLIDEFTTAPFIDSTATKNPGTQGTTILDEIDDAVAEAVRDSLIDLYPRGSRFNKAFSLVIAALKNSTGVEVYTAIPIALYPSDWKDQ